MDDGTQAIQNNITEHARLAASTCSVPTLSNKAIAEWLKSFGPLTPFAVAIPRTQQLLGDKSRSEVYAAAGRGELDAVKDGAKTLITVASIIRYCASMQPAKIAPPQPKRKWTKEARGYVEQIDRFKEHQGKPTTRKTRNYKGSGNGGTP
jgi:hypothetical protein